MIVIPSTPRFRVAHSNGGFYQVTDLEQGTTGHIVAVKFYAMGRRTHSWNIISTDEDGSRAWSVPTDEDMVQAMVDWQEARKNKPQRQEFLYSFESGGWNSEYATSVEEARKQAQERWAHCPDLKPRLDSFKPVKGNEDTYKSLMNLFH